MNENLSHTPVQHTETPPAKQPAETVILSSNSTLFWRIFVPVFSLVFLTGMLLAFWLMEAEALYMDQSALLAIRAVILLFWAACIFFIRRTLWKLKRVDANSQYFYVTDYWTTVRYPWNDLERVEEVKRWGQKIVHFHLKGSGRFGTKISFIPGSYFKMWKAENGY